MLYLPPASLETAESAEKEFLIVSACCGENYFVLARTKSAEGVGEKKAEPVELRYSVS
jgi:hypothetical protein